MVIHWYKSHEKSWALKSAINGLGALVTFFTLLVVGISKFAEGAWLSILIIILLVMLFLRIRNHYRRVGEQLSMRGLPPSLRSAPQQRVVIPVSGVHRGMVEAVNFARSITDQITAVYIDIDPGPDEEELHRRWDEWFPEIRFVVVSSTFRSVVDPLLTYLEKVDLEENDGQRAILILPEIIPARPWQEMLHNQLADEIKKALLYQRHKHGLTRIIIDVPYQLAD